MGLLDRLLARRLKLPRPPLNAVVVQKDLPVRMPDGVLLRADLYSPAPERGDKLPLILIRSPYGKGAMLAAFMARPFAERGFRVLLQCCRGTGRSGGMFEPFRHERADGLATLEWIRQQPWYGGALGTFGASYLGYTQWALAGGAGPELKAMAMQVTMSGFADMTYAGGSLMLENAFGWTHLMALMAQPLRAGWLMLGMLLGLAPIRARQWRRLPLGSLDEQVLHRHVPHWHEWLSHANPDDPWWTSMSYRAALPQIQHPISMLAGWHDIFLPWQLRDFSELQQAGAMVRLTIGPWQHADSELARAGLIDALEWFEQYMGKGPGPRWRKSPVRAYLQGADQWLDLPEWPPRDTQQHSWYLHSASTLGTETPEPSPPTRYRYDPLKPTPSIGGPSLARRASVQNNRVLEARDDVISFTSLPLASALDVVGTSEAHLFVSTDVASVDLFVRLCDVDESGVSRNVCDGLQRVHLHPGAAAVKVLVQLWPTAYRFHVGHRLRVLIASGAFPRWARNLGRDEPLGAGRAMLSAGVSIHHDPHRSSVLRLPIRPDGALPAA